MSVDGCRCIYYETPLPLNLANKQQESNKQASISDFRFGYYFTSLLRALLYPSHLRA